jgi:hypothetical protein
VWSWQCNMCIPHLDLAVVALESMLMSDELRSLSNQ